MKKSYVIPSTMGMVQISVPTLKNKLVKLSDFSHIEVKNKNLLAFYRKDKDKTCFNLKNLADAAGLLERIKMCIPNINDIIYLDDNDFITDYEHLKGIMLSTAICKRQNARNSNEPQMGAALWLRTKLVTLNITEEESSHIIYNHLIPEKYWNSVFVEALAYHLGKPDDFVGEARLYWKLILKNHNIHV